MKKMFSMTLGLLTLLVSIPAASQSIENDEAFKMIFKNWSGKNTKSLYAWIEGAEWQGLTDQNDQFWVLPKDIDRQSSSKYITFWMRGNHEHNSKVPYRTSLRQLSFSCSGSFRQLAVTTRAANGDVIENWDGYGQSLAIRPDTIYAAIEKKICAGD